MTTPHTAREHLEAICQSRWDGEKIKTYQQIDRAETWLRNNPTKEEPPLTNEEIAKLREIIASK